MLQRAPQWAACLWDYELCAHIGIVLLPVKDDTQGALSLCQPFRSFRSQSRCWLSQVPSFCTVTCAPTLACLLATASHVAHTWCFALHAGAAPKDQQRPAVQAPNGFVRAPDALPHPTSGGMLCTHSPHVLCWNSVHLALTAHTAHLPPKLSDTHCGKE